MVPLRPVALALLDEPGDLGAHFIDVADLGPQLLDFLRHSGQAPLQLFQTFDPFLPQVEELLALDNPRRDVFRTARGDGRSRLPGRTAAPPAAPQHHEEDGHDEQDDQPAEQRDLGSELHEVSLYPHPASFTTGRAARVEWPGTRAIVVAVLLILMRHGEAGEADSRRWPDDRQRPLTDAGRREHARVAEALRRMDVRFDRMLSSPLVRARETAEITARIYGASPPELTELLGDKADPALDARGPGQGRGRRPALRGPRADPLPPGRAPDQPGRLGAHRDGQERGRGHRVRRARWPRAAACSACTCARRSSSPCSRPAGPQVIISQR